MQGQQRVAGGSTQKTYICVLVPALVGCATLSSLLQSLGGMELVVSMFVGGAEMGCEGLETHTWCDDQLEATTAHKGLSFYSGKTSR